MESPFTASQSCMHISYMLPVMSVCLCVCACVFHTGQSGTGLSQHATILFSHSIVQAESKNQSLDWHNTACRFYGDTVRNDIRGGGKMEDLVGEKEARTIERKGWWGELRVWGRGGCRCSLNKQWPFNGVLNPAVPQADLEWHLQPHPRVCHTAKGILWLTCSKKKKKKGNGERKRSP